MWTDTSEGKKLISELSKEVVIKLAPEELPLFDEMIQEFFELPEPLPHSEKQSDDLLGFGLPETIPAVTPAAAAAIIAILNYLLVEVIKIVRDDISEELKTKLRSLFSQNTEKSSPISLSENQKEVLRRIALEKGQEFGIDSEKAKQFADILVGALD